MRSWLWLSIFISFLTGISLVTLSALTMQLWIWITGLVLCMPFLGYMLFSVYVGLRYG